MSQNIISLARSCRTGFTRDRAEPRRVLYVRAIFVGATQSRQQPRARESLQSTDTQLFVGAAYSPELLSKCRNAPILRPWSPHHFHARGRIQT